MPRTVVVVAEQAFNKTPAFNPATGVALFVVRVDVALIRQLSEPS
jgi:hypothetical protein